VREQNKMLNLIEDRNFLRDEQKNFIEKILLGPNVSFFIQKGTVEGARDVNKWFCHTIIHHPEEREPNAPVFNSNYAEQALDIFKTFVAKNNILCKQVFRCAVNITLNTIGDFCPIHEDHGYEHKQLLIYLNDCVDKKAKTMLYDKDRKKILHKIKPEKFKGVCFDSCPHNFYFPKKDIRAVLVYTFI
tara:strand:+ start:519 stop:1082 length:564 start_codon:yes stop_codon:yes gene_type:complete